MATVASHGIEALKLQLYGYLHPLQGVFEAEFEEGVLVRAKAGDVYSEPIGKFHRGHNPHPTMPYLCIGVCITPPDKEHVTDVDAPPWLK